MHYFIGGSIGKTEPIYIVDRDWGNKLGRKAIAKRFGMDGKAKGDRIKAACRQ